MATSSHLLPQALHMIPRIPSSSSKNFGVSSFLPRASSVSSKLSVSRVFLSHSGSNFGFPIDSKKRREFIAKAEESTEGETEPVVENAVETVAEGEGEPNVAEEAKPPRKTRVKLGDVMGILNKKAIEVSEKVRPVPELRTGDIVEIKLEVPENRRRLSIYKGIIMSRQNAGIHTTIRIRRIIAGIGVEIVFPIYSPNIKEIKVVSHRKVRRARLYYLRDKLPRLSTFK
ncbi:PREDICTED: 50S ribosomal protein L19-2, chloroplastic [Camelina sativa]|uniref:50S ribosomal protein L19-2, chloroplastic n=1 Tax=Camelina sativa TaxID=90675 RepID=A0ABM0X668_CAMSA|nr:PREDICTED: 50S ribosomal protein L19-2, chloroplastic [Camelina sativa]